MNKQFAKILEIIQPALEAGLEVSLDVWSGNPRVNLNTMAKSDCFLVFENFQIKAKMRYGDEAIINEWEDVLRAVSNCDHGRGYFNSKWILILEKEGWAPI